MNISKLFAAAAAYLVPAIINLVSLLVFTRILTLEDYGQLSLAFISVEFLQGLLFQWIKLAMMRFYDRQNKYVSTAIGMHLNLIITAVLLLLCLLIYFVKSVPGHYDPTFVILVIFSSIGRGYTFFFQDYIRISTTGMKRYTIAAFLTNACYFLPAVVYLLVKHNAKVNELLLVQIAGIYLFFLIYLFAKRKSLLKHVLQARLWPDYKKMLSYGFPLIIVFTASSMFVRIDRFVIEHNVGLSELGAYSAAFSLSNLAISSFFSILTIPTYPAIIRKLNEHDEKAAKAIYQQNGNLILIIAVPILVIASLFNEFFCNIIFADKGAKVALLFPYVVIATFVYNYKVHYFDQTFQFGKKTRIYMVVGITIGAIHLLLGYQLSKFFGGRGVAYSSIALNSLGIIFVYFYSKKFFAITFNKRVVLLVAGIVLGILIINWALAHLLVQWNS